MDSEERPFQVIDTPFTPLTFDIPQQFEKIPEKSEPKPLLLPRFKALNDLDIPSLRRDMLFEDVTNIPRKVWTGAPGCGRNLQTLYIWSKTIQKAYKPIMGNLGTLAFYEDDVKSSMLWTNPTSALERMKATSWAAVVEPNWTMKGDLIAQLYNLYRIRYTGRLLQEHGFKVIPNLVAGDYRTYELAYSTIPCRAPIVCVSIQRISQDATFSVVRHRIKAAVDMIKPEHVIVYGGANGERSKMYMSMLPKGPKYHGTPTWTSLRFETYKKGASGTVIENVVGDLII